MPISDERQKNIAILEFAILAGEWRLAEFEEKYNVSSATFMAEMVAEDLDGGDDEYVRWAGEFKLIERLREKLNQIRERA